MSRKYSDYSNVANATTLIVPTDLPNLELYLNSAISFASASHNDPVTTWPDLSGNSPSRDAGQATANQKPLVQVTSNQSPSGKPLVRFDGINDTLGSSNPTPMPAVTNGYTFYFYGRLREVTAPPGPFAFATIFVDATTGAAPGIGYEQNPNGKPFVTTGAGTFVVHNANIFGPWQLFVVVFNPPSGTGTVQAYQALNNGAVTALVGTPTWSFNPATAGGYVFSSNLVNNGAINADIAAVIWYSSVHSAATIALIRNYLKNVFGEE